VYCCQQTSNLLDASVTGGQGGSGSGHEEGNASDRQTVQAGSAASAESACQLVSRRSDSDGVSTERVWV